MKKLEIMIVKKKDSRHRIPALLTRSQWRRAGISPVRRQHAGLTSLQSAEDIPHSSGEVG
jgi:hypothetical protein